jgi:hypothetical protein
MCVCVGKSPSIEEKKKDKFNSSKKLHQLQQRLALGQKWFHLLLQNTNAKDVFHRVKTLDA